MDLDLVQKISNLAFASYYNPSLDLVVVHFFNKGENKNDIIAYLRHDMSWDVREILDETSELDVLESDGFLGEDITISHERIGIYEKSSNFDKFVRAAIDALTKKAEDEESLEMIDERVLRVLKGNAYDSGKEAGLFVSKTTKHLN